MQSSQLETMLKVSADAYLARRAKRLLHKPLVTIFALIIPE